MNSDLIFLTAVITRDQTPSSWLSAGWERGKWKGSWLLPARIHTQAPGSWDRTWVRCRSKGSSSAHDVEEAEEESKPNSFHSHIWRFLPMTPNKNGKRSKSMAYWSGLRKTKATLWMQTLRWNHLGQSSMHLRGGTQVHRSCSRKKV